MRLDRIKLAGFKSFVDPTTIPTPGNLIGIVGPNGCGKSNIIDAVRWVMGESSAKHLRGESMADVIFNGSSSRKPVGLASVELVFDNAEGKAPGEFAQYPEISIKRQVTRDGQSTYILNGTRCRRKDITDLFLGTGLGSRSYAIIEQGTISRLIEAKPQELRELIEEAAGISKYKERRHETELRMGHTQENLDRLMDLREEVFKQIESLKRQAKKAEKYTVLRDEELRHKEQLLALRWKKHEVEYQKLKSQLEITHQQFLSITEQEYVLKEQLDGLRQHQEGLQKTLHQEQAQFYELGADISKRSQTLKHAQETHENLLKEEARLMEEQRSAQMDLDHDQQQLEDIREELVTLTLEMESVTQDESEKALAREATALELRQLRESLENLRTEIAQIKGEESLQHSKTGQIEQQTRQLALRRERLVGEQREIELSLHHQALPALEQAVVALEAESQLIAARRIEVQEKLERQREHQKSAQQQLNQQLAEIHGAEGRISSLETLQQHAMGKDRVELQDWLTREGLHETPRLAETLDVEPQWESAVENLLGFKLQALCIDSIHPYLDAISRLEEESLSLIERTALHATKTTSGPSKLLEKVHSPWNLDPLIGSIYCADSLLDAHEISQNIAPHESVITPNGTRLGPGWIAIEALDDGKAGLIRRERELKRMKSELSALRLTLHESETRLEELELGLIQSEQQRSHFESEERALVAAYERAKSELSTAKSLEEQFSKRHHQVVKELEDLTLEQSDYMEALEEAQQAGSSATLAIERLDQLMAQQLIERERLDALKERADQSLQEARESLGALKGRQESLRSNEQLTQRHLERARQQFEQTKQRLGLLQGQVETFAQPEEGAQEILENLIEERDIVEKSLTQRRQEADAIERDIRHHSEAMLLKERERDNIKASLESIKLELSANEVRRQTVLEQCEEMACDPHQLMAELPENADEKTWQQRVTELGLEINRLGPVNLTAMEEYQAQEERMIFMDEQHRDLEDSLTTLRDAIEKIDRECRSRFKETFDLINGGLQRMFPKLFGGGQASLELTDRDLLDAGVTVMARPPGKRNSSIHLLSGGEKALTAAALVFAIFELNPAPFCLLDEVDAPLDDANVGRFSQLVKEMSERVQFLFISHNKATMEIAQHLAGVTMKEPGVSRIVAVDIDAAFEMTNA